MAEDQQLSTTVNKSVIKIGKDQFKLKKELPVTIRESFYDEETSKGLAEKRKQTLLNEAAIKWPLHDEDKVFYLEDWFEGEERERIISGFYEKNRSRDAETNHSIILQQAFDAIPDGSIIKTRKTSRFLIDKNENYMVDEFSFKVLENGVYKKISRVEQSDGPDTRGQLQRQLAEAGELRHEDLGLELRPMQPCVYIHHKRRLYIDFNGTMFIVKKLGQSAFYLGSHDGYNSGNHFIKDFGIFTTRWFQERGYKGGKKGFMPPIDGWSEEHPNHGNGYSTKGYWKFGFNTSNYTIDLSRFDNNSAITENIQETPALTKLITRDILNRVYENGNDAGLQSDPVTKLSGQELNARSRVSPGGYINKETGKHEFPQEDGTTAERWGTWGGMQYGSNGNAITIFGDEDTVIMDFLAEGFHGGAIVYGRLGRIDGVSVERGDIKTAEANGLVARRQYLLGGNGRYNYTGVVGLNRVDRIVVSGLECDGIVGHPDWHVQHSRSGTSTNIDPGYGLWVSRSLPMTDIRAEHNNFGVCARKVMDAHCGSKIYYRWNKGTAGYYGVSVVVGESLATGDDGVTEELLTHTYSDSVMDISYNTFTVGVMGLHFSNGDLGPNERRKLNKWWLRGNFIVHGNNIYAPSGLYYNYGHYGFSIKDNVFTYALPFGESYGSRAVRNIRVTKPGTGYKIHDRIVIDDSYESTGSYDARGCFGWVTEVDANGGIKAVGLNRGHDYYKAPRVSHVITENGTGAEFETSTINGSAAVTMGAWRHRGPAFGDKIVDNRIRNSRDGNFAYAFNLYSLVNATITGNIVESSPYYTIDPVMKETLTMPYASKRAFRSGIETNPYYMDTSDGGTGVIASKWDNNWMVNDANGKYSYIKEPPTNKDTYGVDGNMFRGNNYKAITVPVREDKNPDKELIMPAFDASEERIIFNFKGDRRDDYAWDTNKKYPVVPFVTITSQVNRYANPEWYYIDPYRDRGRLVTLVGRINGTPVTTGQIGLLQIDFGDNDANKKSTISAEMRVSSKGINSYGRVVLFGNNNESIEGLVPTVGGKRADYFYIIQRGNQNTIYVNGSKVPTTTDADITAGVAEMNGATRVMLDQWFRISTHITAKGKSLAVGSRYANGAGNLASDMVARGNFIVDKFIERSEEEMATLSVKSGIEDPEDLPDKREIVFSMDNANAGDNKVLGDRASDNAVIELASTESLDLSEARYAPDGFKLVGAI